MSDRKKTKQELLQEIVALRRQISALQASVPEGTGARAEVLPDTQPSSLHTVSVPERFEEPFLAAQDYVRQYFASKAEDPDLGTIDISGERYILVRASSMSVEFFDLVRSFYEDRGEEEARKVASGFLYDIAHALGKADARAFHSRMNVTDPIEKLSAGPIHFAHAGWAFVEIHPESTPQPNEDCFLSYDHPYSFEADAWMKRGIQTEFPVCIMNAGYSSGWCEESFGVPLVAVETDCRARGDDQCRFVMSHPSRIEHHLKRKSVSSRKIPDRAGPHDIPEFFQRKRLEDKLRKSHAELERRVEQRTAELVETNRKLKREIRERERTEEELLKKQKLESLGLLAGGIAHDFNNLLTAIMGNISLVKRSPHLEANIHEVLAEIENVSVQAQGLTQQLLTFSKGGAPIRETVSVADIVTDTVRFALRGSNVHCEFSVAEDLWTARVDKGQIIQVISNLIVNAKQSMPEGGTIRVRAGNRTAAKHEDPLVENTRYVALSVADQGVGIPAEHLSKIFDPYFTTKQSGSGLGLAVSYSIVQKHGGHIAVKSLPGKGTVLHVYLPASKARKKRAKVQKSWETPGGGKILIMDDDSRVRKAVHNMLVALGYDAEAVSKGEDAIESYRREKEAGRPYDLVILDMTVTSGMGGKATLRKLKELDPAVKAVVSSGYSTDPIMANHKKHGFSGVLPKPFDLQDLRRVLQETLPA